MKHLPSKSKESKRLKSLKTERHLKVQYLNRSSRFSESKVPQLRINGNWLEVAGFKIGSQVKVEVSAGQLVIKLVEEKPEETHRA